jgi:hypothetical protein
MIMTTNAAIQVDTGSDRRLQRPRFRHHSAAVAGKREENNFCLDEGLKTIFSVLGLTPHRPLSAGL